MANDYKYRADPIGLMVPPEVIEGAPTAEQLDTWTKRALAMQATIGLPVCSDGEYRRAKLAEALVQRGLAGAPPALVEQEFAFARAATRSPLKVSLPSPSSVVRAVGGDLDATAAIKSLAAESAALIAAGAAYLQFNAAAYDELLGPDAPADATAKIATYAAWDRELLAGISRPDNVRIGVRFGRAAGAPVWAADAAAASLFSLPADRYLIDFGLNPQDFSVLTLVPAGAQAVLGLLDNQCKTAQSTDALLVEIDAAAKVLNGAFLSLSPRGGFSAKNGVTWAQQRNTLEQLVEVATRWWGFAL